mmetsp:Transcript_1046/g.1424  ORF Transcript_1046/g.1424 Transcript_1046/m.1424 type:complete len:275 (-) Transcript_1046:67-891(-)
MFHRVGANQSARPAQACLAVDGKDARVPLAHLQELVNDEIRRRRPVDEKHVCVVDSIFSELRPVVLSLVQAHNVGHAEVPEDLQVVFRLVTAAIWPNLVDRAHESNELAREHPVQVSIFDFLVILVLLVVEFAEVVPAVADGDLEALEAVEDRAAVGAVAVAGVAEGPETSLVGREGLPGHLGGLAQDNHHKSAHEVGGVGLLVEHIRAVVEKLHVLEALVSEHSAQLTNELVGVRQIQWAKVRVKRFVDQFIIHIEEVGIVVALRGSLRTYPV